MADSETITIPLHLPRAKAAPLARMVARLDERDCARLSSPCVTCDGKAEADVMWSGLLILEGAMAFAGSKL